MPAGLVISHLIKIGWWSNRRRTKLAAVGNDIAANDVAIVLEPLQGGGKINLECEAWLTP